MGMQNETRSCANCKGQFIIDTDDFSFYEKMKVPAPTWCPDCRFQRRLLFRNERTYYRRQCDLCQKNIISTYSSDAPFPVYCVHCWYSDGWDAYKYGVDFDFSRPFFEQFKELIIKVPALSIMNDEGVASTGCEYSYDWFYSKNSYLTVCGWQNENVLYSYHIEHVKDTMDSMHMRESELCYGCLMGYKLSRCTYCENCQESQDCHLSRDLQGCTSCVMCVGLRNKSYCIKNKQYTKDEYKKEVEAMNLTSRESAERYKKEFAEFAVQFPRRFASVYKSVDTTGNLLLNCKNSQECFFGRDYENCKHIVLGDGGKDAHDLIMTGKAELAYDCVTIDYGYRSSFTVYCMQSKFVDYSYYTTSAENCFGCVGLKKGSYAIFNKQYSKDEYEVLRTKIIEHMKKTGEYGQFFPYWVSPFAYNETAAQEWLPLTKDDALSKGYRWRDPEAKNYAVTLKSESVPDSVSEIPQNIESEVIGCAHAGTCNHKCTTAFKIVPAELQLYKRLNIPLPVECPNCRHAKRFANVPPPRLWKQTCMCDKSGHEHEGSCANQFETPYDPNGTDIVYCEKCYQKEVI